MIPEASDLVVDVSIPQGWRLHAACIDISNPDVFFPAVGHSADEARAICRRCPVKDDCLSFAVRQRIPYGIWGGMNYNERRDLHAPSTQRTHCCRGHLLSDENVIEHRRNGQLVSRRCKKCREQYMSEYHLKNRESESDLDEAV
jgi:WhiB family redox-sensing transcriptional regulator